MQQLYCDRWNTRTYWLSIFHGLKEIIFSYLYFFLANSCTDCSIFHVTFSTQREKDVSEVLYETWEESTRLKLLGTSLFGISPEKNTVLVVFAKIVYWKKFATFADSNLSVLFSAKTNSDQVNIGWSNL